MNELGSLSGCILENDPETQDRARWLRGKALAVSLTLEVTLLSAILIMPLLHPGALGGRLVVTPLPPYSGGNNPVEEHRRTVSRPSPSQYEAPRICLVCAQPTRPEVSSNTAGNGEAPIIGTGFDPGVNTIGPFIVGGDPNARTPMEPKKPEPTQRSGPQHISEGVMEAALIHKVQPQYPKLAQITHVSGTVQLRAIIGTDGRIRELEVLSGNALLQPAAVAAVREWRYRPTLLNGQAVEVETLITVNFVLGQE
jgi:periplasmic protein TonB